MGNILKKRTRYIVPFMTVGDKKLEINGSGWVKDLTQRGEHDVYQYIIGSLCPGGGILQSNIGQSYRYERKEDSILSLLYYPKGKGPAAFEFDIYGNLDDLFKKSDEKMYAMKVLRDKYRRD